MDPSRPSFQELSQHRVHQLSEIGETSEPSPPGVSNDTITTTTISNKVSPHDSARVEKNTPSPEYVTPAARRQENHHSRWNSRATSALSLPLCDIPERRSSMSMLNRKVVGTRHASMQELQSQSFTQERVQSAEIHPKGRAESPVRYAVACGVQSSEASRVSCARTFVRTTPPVDTLDNASLQHPRFEIWIRLPSPLCMGGGTVEGYVELRCDQDAKRTAKSDHLFISSLDIDVIGVEAVAHGRRNIFLSLATELFDRDHPPPPALVVSQTSLSTNETLWETQPSKVLVPFCVNLPLNLGPPPYQSKSASIRYVICASAAIRVDQKQITVRQSYNCQMLSVHDPEKALGSLPTPLLASDTLTVAHTPEQNIKMTAGLHRQTWINRGTLFADVHIANNSAKILRKFELRLVKTTLFYAHTAASTAEKSARHLRLPKRSETEVISSSVVKKTKNWPGILPHSSEVRTCEVDIPSGHVTISSGRYFEVRFHICFVIDISIFKHLAVQLPVTIIHINSLDVLPNALSQVAASIEATRSRAEASSDHYAHSMPYHQGQAFAAAQRQSLAKDSLTCTEFLVSRSDTLLDGFNQSPKRQKPPCSYKHARTTTLDSTGSTEPVNTCRLSIASHHHHRRHPSCYHCHLLHSNGSEGFDKCYTGPQLPRLQVSTSGLGFSETEFELPADSPPRKVMLSEQERKVLNQQRELNLQREQSSKSAKNEQHSATQGGTAPFVRYRNVAAVLDAEQKSLAKSGRKTATSPNNLQRMEPPFKNFQRPYLASRTRSRTDPENLANSAVYAQPIRSSHERHDRGRSDVHGIDRGYRFPKLVSLTDDDVFLPKQTKQHPGSKPFMMHGMRAL